MYFLKLAHLVDDKIHARSTGPIPWLPSSPGRKGSVWRAASEKWRFGRWKHTVLHTLQEILTVKSDDVVGRVKTYEAIVRVKTFRNPVLPRLSRY